MLEISAADKELSSALLGDFRTFLEDQAWWHSKRRRDRERRSSVEVLMRSLAAYVEIDQLSSDAVSRILDRQKDDLKEKPPEVLGYSVGYKKPRSRRIRWIDIPGANDPLEASKSSRKTLSGLELMQTGYEEYGISPILRR